jgi:hypothetical protein
MSRNRRRRVDDPNRPGPEKPGMTVALDGGGVAVLPDEFVEAARDGRVPGTPYGLPTTEAPGEIGAIEPITDGPAARVSALVEEFVAAAVVAVIAQHESPLMIGRRPAAPPPRPSGGSSGPRRRGPPKRDRPAPMVGCGGTRRARERPDPPRPPGDGRGSRFAPGIEPAGCHPPARGGRQDVGRPAGSWPHGPRTVRCRRLVARLPSQDS